jgi:hypothetical protein
MPAPKTEVEKKSSSVNLSAVNRSAMNLEEQIRVRAYQLYEERGYTPGHEAEDWLVAEREVLGRGDDQQSA